MIGRLAWARHTMAATAAMMLLAACGTSGAPDGSPRASVPESATPTPSGSIASSPSPPAATPAGASTPAAVAEPTGMLAYVVDVAFGATSFIHVASADGTRNEPIAEGDAPAWSPDGSRIAYSCRLPETEAWNFDICIMNADGSDPQLLVVDALRPIWSPDGTRILFNTSPIDAGFSRVMDTDGTNIQDVGPGAADWSPDGAWIMLRRLSFEVDSLRIMRADGTDLRSFESVGLGTVWSPDSGRLAGSWFDGTVTEIQALAIETGTIETLLTVDGAAVSLAWLTDETIAYVRSDASDTPRAMSETSGIWIADLASADQTQLTSGTPVAGSLVPSPDGRWLAFALGHGPASEIALVSLDGALVRLTDSGTARLPTWRPASPSQ